VLYYVHVITVKLLLQSVL